MKTKLFFAFIFLISHLAFGQWTQLGTDIDGETANDESGQSISLSADGNIVAIGTYLNYGGGIPSGYVRVYQFQSGNWAQMGTNIDGEAIYDESGRSVSLSADGSIVAIGATSNDGNGNSSGHVRVYQFQNGNWVQMGNDIDGEAFNDKSGGSVSLSTDGSRVAIGAVNNDGNGNNSGHVRVYEFQNGNWVQLGADIDGEAAEDRSGRSVSLSADGSILAIGASFNNGNGIRSGHVRVYEYQSGNWVQLGNDIDGEAADDRFGWFLSLSTDGSRVAIAGPLNDENGNDSGHVRVYEYQSGSWVQLGTDIDGEAAEDRSGISVSLSADGNSVAIGALFNSGNGNNSGHVRVYQFQSGNWGQVSTDIDGEAAEDQSGQSVSLSADGSIVAIGAHRNDGNGNDSGHVRIYVSPYTAIPDASFEAALNALGYDDIPGDGQVPTANISGITFLDVSSQNIADLTGIEAFAALETLRCHNNQLTSLDLSQNTGLTTLWCLNNQLASLDISQNLILETLYCSDNQLTGLDVSQNTNLTNLNCADNPLGSLDVSQNTSLTTLSCDNNQLSGLDVSQNINLTNLSCSTNQLTNLDVSQNLILETLWCQDNQLASLDISQNTMLTILLCHNNQLASLDVSQNLILETLWCHNNQLASLDLSQNTGLTFLYCQNNPLSGSLILSGLNGLTILNATNTPGLLCIQVDDEAAANAGTGIYAGWSKDLTASYSETCYTAIPDTNFEAILGILGYDDISTDHQVPTANIYRITTLNVSGQNIADLTGIEGFKALQSLYCNSNQLTSLDLSQNINLTVVWCYGNHIGSLDVSQNSMLTTLLCQNNSLTSLDVSQNLMLTSLQCHTNPNLSCIEVDNATDANAGSGIYAGWIKDNTAIYSENCGAMAKGTIVSTVKDQGIPEEAPLAASDIKLYPNPVRDNVHLTLPAGKELLNATVYNTNGQQVAASKTNRISLKKLPTGIYFVILQFSDGARITKKVIVSRE